MSEFTKHRIPGGVIASRSETRSRAMEFQLASGNVTDVQS